jgi:small subunit ribosomal protein S1
MKFINKQLNADAQEPASTETVDQAAAATTTQPEAAPIAVSAHDDFDWSIDKRNVSHYSENDRVKYDKVYDNTFVQIEDGEIIRGMQWLPLQKQM